MCVKIKDTFLLYDFVRGEYKGRDFCCFSGGACVDMQSSILTAASDRFRQVYCLDSSTLESTYRKDYVIKARP